MSLKNLFAAIFITLISFTVQAGPKDTLVQKKQRLEKTRATQALCRQIGPQIAFIPKALQTREVCDIVISGLKIHPTAIVRAGHLKVIVPAPGTDRWHFEFGGNPPLMMNVVAKDLRLGMFSMNEVLVMFQDQDTGELIRDTGMGGHVLPDAKSAMLN